MATNRIRLRSILSNSAESERISAGAEQHGDHDGAADVAAEGECEEDQRDLVAVSHGGQGIFPDEFSGHEAVRDIVKPLENDTAKQRQTEFPEHGFRFSYSQILIHNRISFPLAQHSKSIISRVSRNGKGKMTEFQCRFALEIGLKSV